MKILRVILLLTNYIILVISLIFVALSGMIADNPTSNSLLASLFILVSLTLPGIVGIALFYDYKQKANSDSSIKILPILYPILYLVLHFFILFQLNNALSKQKIEDENNAVECHKKGYHPICGSDDKSYINKCFAEKLGVSYKHDGECEQE